MKHLFRGMNMFRTLGNVETRLPAPSEIISGQVKVGSSGTPVQITATPTPLTCGVYLASAEATGSKHHYVGTTANKPTYDSGATGAKSSGQVCYTLNPVFWECDDLSEIWIDCNDDNKTLTYYAY